MRKVADVALEFTLPLDELQYAQDQADIALCEATKAKDEPDLSHEAFMAALDAEDSGQPGG